MILANITDREHYYSLHPKMKQLWDYILTHDLDFDILAMTEHGVHGKEWDKEPKIVPLFLL